VLDVDQTPEGIIFFVMEYLEGSDIADVLEREGSIGWGRAQHIALQVCAALAAAHERGVVHRDLKPSNCFLVPGDADVEVVKVLDFGIAKVLESNGTQAGRRGPRPGTGRDLRWLKTSTGEVFGTLAYMAPEHLNGDPHDHRVDIYAVGVILYEMLTGSTPFSPDAPGTFIQQVLFEPPEAPSRRAPKARIPPDLDYVVLRALEKRPEDRFSSMDELAEALAAVRRDAALPEEPADIAIVEVAEPAVAVPVSEARAPPRAAARAAARPSAPAKTKERDLPVMAISPYDRQKLFVAHRDAISARCKGRSQDNALIVLQITIEAGEIVRAVLNSGTDRDAKREAAARCIQKYLKSQVDVPRSMSGRATFFYAF